jgi:hypothetical protein
MTGNFQVRSHGIPTLVSSSEKTSWSLKTSYCKKNSSINSKTVMKNFSDGRLCCKSQSVETLTPGKIFMTNFEFIGQLFFQNDDFKL